VGSSDTSAMSSTEQDLSSRKRGQGGPTPVVSLQDPKLPRLWQRSCPCSPVHHYALWPGVGQLPLLWAEAVRQCGLFYDTGEWSVRCHVLLLHPETAQALSHPGGEMCSGSCPLAPLLVLCLPPSTPLRLSPPCTHILHPRAAPWPRPYSCHCATTVAL
jgi:hypothetical protein